MYIYRSYTDTCKYHHACTCGRLDSTWYPPRAASEVLQLAALLRVQISVHSLCTSKWIKNYSCFSLRGTLHVPSSRWQAGEDWGLKRRCWSLKDFPIFSILHHSSLFHHTSSDVHHILSIPIQRFLGACFRASKADLLKPLDPPPTGKMLEELMYSQEPKILKMGTSF